jgi:hypothetical protein
LSVDIKGNCFFGSVAAVLNHQHYLNAEWTQEIVRAAGIDSILNSQDEFAAFLENNFDGSETLGEYVSRMCNDGEWASHEIILAVSRALGLRVEIHFSSGGVSLVMEERDGEHVNLLYYSDTHYEGLVKLNL